MSVDMSVEASQLEKQRGKAKISKTVEQLQKVQHNGNTRRKKKGIEGIFEIITTY